MLQQKIERVRKDMEDVLGLERTLFITAFLRHKAGIPERKFGVAL
jgi:hypothetical protein